MLIALLKKIEKIKGGPIGVLKADYVEITQESLSGYKNQGGFDIISELLFLLFMFYPFVFFFWDVTQADKIFLEFFENYLIK